MFKKIISLLELPDSIFETKIGDYYTALSTDKRFILLDDGKWDLRSRHTSDKLIKVVEDEDDEEEIEEIKEEELNEEEDFDSVDSDEDDIDDNDDDLKDLVILDEDEAYYSKNGKIYRASDKTSIEDVNVLESLL